MSIDPGSERNAADFIPNLRHDTYTYIDPTKCNLEGQSVVLSGASKGIGKATAISYAKAGISAIVLLARSSLDSVEKEMIAAAQAANRPAPKVLTYKVDVTSQAQVDAAAQDVEKQLGHIDILINNAGSFEECHPFHETKPDDWWWTWEVNIRGPYLLTRAFTPLLLKAGCSTIINVSSIGAHVMIPGGSAYHTSKFALLRLSETINKDYEGKGIYSYSIHPGGVLTELAENLPKDFHHLLVDTPELSADATVFLTNEKRDWLAGRYYSVTWDMEDFLNKKDEIVKGDLLKTRLALR